MAAVGFDLALSRPRCAAVRFGSVGFSPCKIIPRKGVADSAQTVASCSGVIFGRRFFSACHKS